jgi:hypothetical protein
LLKLSWRLELAVGIAHIPITPFCMGEAGRRSQELGPICSCIYCNNHGGHGDKSGRAMTFTFLSPCAPCPRGCSFAARNCKSF